MVHIYPNKKEDLDKPDSKTHQSEKDTYDLFLSLNDDWYVWHSVEWHTSNLNPRETDFIVFNKKYGFIIIEVKGGNITYKDNKWTYKGSDGDLDPVKQARRAMFFFINRYTELAYAKSNPYNYLNKGRKKDFFPGKVWYGVVFPYSNFKEIMIKHSILILNLEPHMIFGAKDFENHRNWEKTKIGKGNGSPVEQYLMNIFTQKIIPNFKPLYGEKMKRVKSLFKEMINPTIEASYLMNIVLDKMNEDLEKVNKEQDYILEQFKNKNWNLFTGSAGTGKTFIAIKKALLLLKSNQRVLLLCFNRELKYFILDLIKNFFEVKITNKLVIRNLHSFIKGLIENHFPKDDEVELIEALFGVGSIKPDYEMVVSKIYEFIKEDGLKEEFLFDALIVDEAQDISEEFWPLLKHFLKSKNRGDCVFYVFYDMEQKKFVPEITVDKFGLDKEDTFPLLQNLRNTNEIIDWIKENTKHGYYRKKSQISGLDVIVLEKKDTLWETFILVYLKARELNIINKLNLEDMIILCDKQLRYLNYPKIVKKNDTQDSYVIFQTMGSQIVFIEPSKNIRYSEIKKEKRFSNTILYNGIGTFKGLEKKIVFLIIPNLRNLNFMKNIELYNNLLMDTYIGASRARLMLIVAMYDNI